ncbi:hypothetical protein NDU88_005349 [Pleurodeles waltl]|uniref:CCHC-type domain-containing protein n=1 Tax=Pleurodeles waltl TaxID=8319 RepID=A0AAV7WAS4_PLEWA|nr:hypothetical protein NDU88_005349 [Pleurodeles waltl]
MLPGTPCQNGKKTRRTALRESAACSDRGRKKRHRVEAQRYNSCTAKVPTQSSGSIPGTLEARIYYPISPLSIGWWQRLSGLRRTSLFFCGLRDDLKDVLAQIVEPPTECSEFIDLVVRLDHHLSERKGEKFQGGTRLVVLKTEEKEFTFPTHDTPEPMQIGSVRGPLSKEVKERRKRLKLCLYCSKAGHFAWECPNKPTAPKKAIEAVTGPEFSLPDQAEN